MTLAASTRDAFDSPLFFPSYVVLPVAAAVGAFMGIDRAPLAWAVGLVLPGMCWTFVGGFLLFDEANGASFWPIGEAVLVVLFGLIAVGAALGAFWVERAP